MEGHPVYTGMASGTAIPAYGDMGPALGCEAGANVCAPPAAPLLLPLTFCRLRLLPDTL